MSYLPVRKMRPNGAPLRKTAAKGKHGVGSHLTQISPLAATMAAMGGNSYMTAEPKARDRSEDARRDMFAGGIVVAAILAAAFYMFVIIIKNLYVCPPSEVLIFSGRRRRLKLPGGQAANLA